MKKYSTSVSKLISKEDLGKLINLEHSSKKKILVDFGFDINTIDIKKSEITLKISTDEEFVKLTPTINISYYNENDKLTKRVKKIPSNDDLVTFEGEIYENLNFNSIEEARVFADTIALIHFKGLEWNMNKIAEVEAVKNITERNGSIGDREYDILRSNLARA